eukprot:1854177-Pyramimonas_sp.AAC.1
MRASVDPKQQVIALWMRQLCGARYEADATWSNARGANCAVPAMLCKLWGVRYVVEAMRCNLSGHV